MRKRGVKDGPGQMLLDLRSKPGRGVAQATAVTPITTGETLLVDGANVMRANNHDTRLEILMALLVELRKAGGNFCCIFDASAKFQLRKHSGQKAYEAFLQLVATYPHHFALSTGGLRADDLLLQRANSLKQRIVTNDRFNDFRDRYTWLQEEQRHLVKFALVGQELQVPSLGIMVKWDRQFGELAKELIELLGKPASSGI